MLNFWIPPFNPFSLLGSGAAKIVAEGWTTLMVAIWNGGLWVLKLILTLSDYFTLPDLSADGPAAQAYAVMTWAGLSLLVILTAAQLGISVFRRDGKSLAQVFIGVGQFIVIWSCYITVAVAILVAVQGITKALMNTMLQVDSWAEWDPIGVVVPEDLSDGTLATVLGFMGLFLWVAGLGHFLIMLARGVALIVLAVTAPVAAAGLSAGFGRSWFWKSLRWFLAAAFTPILVVMVLGIGVMITSGIIWEDMTDFQAILGSAIPSVILICVSSFSPLVLFKLLAFVDPGTSSGAAMRAGLASSGGIQGLLGSKAATDSTSNAASTTDDAGRSQAEKSASSDTSERASKGLGSLIGTAGAALGPVGAVVGTGLGMGLNAMTKVGTNGGVIGADLTNQMGVGHGTYIPEVGHARRSYVPASGGGAPAGDYDDADPPTEDEPDDGHPAGPRRGATAPPSQTPLPSPPPPPTPGPAPAAAPPSPGPSPSPPAAPGNGPGAGAGNGASAGAAAGNGAGAAAGAAVPPPV